MHELGYLQLQHTAPLCLQHLRQLVLSDRQSVTLGYSICPLITSNASTWFDLWCTG